MKDKQQKAAIAHVYNSKPIHKVRRNELQRLRYQRNKTIVDALKSKPCMDCGNSYPPYVRDFDHVRGTKTDNVSAIMERRPVAALLIEIAKCDMVCSNCHRIRTFNRQ